MKIRSGVLAAFVLCGCMLFAEDTTTATSSLTFTTGSEAVALNYDGSWSAATRITEALDMYDFGKTKANKLFIGGVQLMASDAGFSYYGGSITVQPNLASLLSKTNISSDNLSASANASIGNVIYSASTTSSIGYSIGGELKYKLTSSGLTWTAVHYNYFRVGGKNAHEMSSGIAYVFGKK